MECHGSIHYLQCIDDCQSKLWSSDHTIVEIEEGFKAKEPLPSCPFCGGMARPNILMFNDFTWNYSRTDSQRERLKNWIETLEKQQAKVVIVEIGAGTAVPTVRNTSEQIARKFDLPLIRINPRESFGAEVALEMRALEALSHIIV